MRFVPIKSAEQQATLMLHKTREQLTKQRTMNINALRGQLSEFGLVAAKGIEHVKGLATAKRTPTTKSRAGLRGAFAAQITALDTALRDIEEGSSASRARPDKPADRWDTRRRPDHRHGDLRQPPEPRVFKSARDFAAFLGLTPRQNSSGGKDSLGGITRRATAIYESCWSSARPRCCASRKTQGRARRLDRRATGQKTGAPRQRWRSPTSSPESSGRW